MGALTFLCRTISRLCLSILALRLEYLRFRYVQICLPVHAKGGEAIPGSGFD